MDQETGKVDYRGLVDELRSFNYEEAVNNKNPIEYAESTKNNFSKTPGETRKRKTIFEDDYIVLDSQKVPNNVLESIEQRLSRVTRYLKRHFGSEKALDKALKENLVEQDKNGNLSVDDLKTFVLQTCKEQIIHRNLNKKDIEAFLSAFNYNAYGATQIDTVAKMVFTNDNYVTKELSRKIRANPPPDGVNQDLRESIYEEANEDEIAQPTSKTVFNGPIDYKKAAEVLKEIESKVYVGGLPRAGTFQSVFRSVFDVDGDGFVSHADFEGACRKLQI